jgi:hypothetical protein
MSYTLLFGNVKIDWRKKRKNPIYENAVVAIVGN